MIERLILASGSPRRRDLLKGMGVPFDILPPEGPEPEREPAEPPAGYAIRSALHKARQIAARPDAIGRWLLAADTIVVLDDEVMGKPGSRADAVRMIEALSGRGHEVVTGFAIVDPRRQVEHTEAVVTGVWFRELSAEHVRGYVETGEPMDKAGAYGIQGHGAFLVSRIEGSYNNVVGLPLARVLAVLEDLGAGSVF